MRTIRNILIFGAILLTGPGLQAKDIYVSQSGAGSQNGTTVFSAFSYAWLQSPYYYGTNAPAAGDTIHLVGTLTNTIHFDPHEGYPCGAPGSNITLLFEPDAKLSAPTLSSPNFIWMYVAGASNLVIDGGANGVIRCTQNGTASNNTNYCGVRGANIYTNYVEGIYASDVDNFTVRNLTISNLYARLPSSNDTNCFWNKYATGINLTGNNILIQSNAIWNTAYPIIYNFSGAAMCSNITIIGNVFNGYVWGIAGGDNTANALAALTGFTIRSNMFNQLDDYEGVNKAFVDAGMAAHRNTIYFQAENYPFATNNYCAWPADPSYTSHYTNTMASFYGGLWSNVDISCNRITAGTPTSQTTSSGSSAIWMGSYSTNQFRHVRIYNNIFTTTQASGWGIGINTECSSDVLVANNTFIGSGPANVLACIAAGAADVRVFNNLEYNCSGYMNLNGVSTSNTVCVTGCTAVLAENLQYFANEVSDYNIIPVGANQVLELLDAWGTCGVGYVTGIYNLSQWQALSSNFDPHSTTKVPALDTNTWRPLPVDTVAHGAGTNLSACFSNDFYGRPRPATGAWDIGAAMAQASP